MESYTVTPFTKSIPTLIVERLSTLLGRVCLAETTRLMRLQWLSVTLNIPSKSKDSRGLDPDQKVLKYLQQQVRQ